MNRKIKITAVGVLALFLVVQFQPILASVASIESPQAQDSMVIIHPHSADFAGYVISGFRTWYEAETGNTISVDTIEKDSGACYDEVLSWNSISPLADIYWGGGRYYFELARNEDLLHRYEVAEDANITDYLGGWNLKDLNDTHDPAWYGAAISGFGIMYNKEVLDGLGLPYPETWDDLTNPDYSGQIIMATPDKSGSTCATVKQVLMEKNSQTDAGNITAAADITEGWEYWAKVAGNVEEYPTDSADVPSKVYEGHYGIGITIDYYAWDKIALWDQIGFNYGEASTFSPDPVAIVKGASKLTEAQHFMDYITSTEGQQRVGKYRIPANIKAVPDSLRIPRAWTATGDINPDFPVITPFNITIDDEWFYPTKKMFHYWFVNNRESAVASWTAIDAATDITARDNAIALHTKLPGNFDGTSGNLSAMNTGSGIYGSGTDARNYWAQEGADNFGNATVEAAKSYGNPINPTTTTPAGTTTEEPESTTSEGEGQVPGFEIFVLLATIGTLVILRRKRN